MLDGNGTKKKEGGQKQSRDRECASEGGMNELMRTSQLTR
jgi:hypothetical protein